MFRFLNRHREPLVVGALLLLPLLVFLRVGHRGRDPNPIDRLVLALSSPLQGALTWLLDGARDGVSGYVALRGAHEEAAICRVQLAETSAEVNSLREAAAENERLRRVLGYVETTGEQEILARVVGLNPAVQFQSLRINRGEDDGVRVGMPVVAPVRLKDGTPAGAVVGQVVRAVGGSADVMLVTDPASRVSVVSQRSRVRGTAVGSGDGRLLALDYALRDDDVLDGDFLVASGTDGIFPRGLLVGQVHDVKKPTVGMFLTARIDPATDLRRLEEVLVIPSAVGPAAAVGKGGAP